MPVSMTLEECVRLNLERYFTDLDGQTPSGVHAMVMSAVERPVLQVVLERVGGNQSRAAEILGINRNTLRKKLEQHQLLGDDA